MPPRTPPAWLVRLYDWFRLHPLRNASLFSEPADLAAANPSPISKPFTAPMEQDGLRQVGVQLFKHRLSQARRKPVRHALHDAAGRVAGRHLLLRDSTAARSAASLSGMQRRLFSASDRSNRSGSIATRADGFRVRLHRNPQARQHLCRHSARRHASDGLPGRGTSAAAVIPEAKFLIKGDSPRAPAGSMYAISP